MKKSKVPSILNKFSVAYLVQILVAFTISGFLFMGVSYFQKNKTFLKEINSYAESFANVIAYPLWSYDFDAVGRYTQVFAENKDVYAVSVFDDAGKTVISWVSPYSKEAIPAELSKKIIKPVFFNNKKIGAVEILYSKERLKSFVNSYILLMLCLIVVLTIIMLIGSRYLIKNYILVPFEILSDAIEEVEKGKYEYDAIGRDVKFREFGKLLNEIEKMVNAIKSREDELSEVNEELSILLKSMPDGFVLMDSGGNILQVNESFVEMFKYSEEKLKNMNVMDLSDETFSKNLFKNYLEEALKNGLTSFRWIAKSKDGRSFWIFVRLSVVVLKGEKYFIALVHDIDEEVKLQEKLKESEEKFRAFAENTKAAVFLYSEYFEYVNPATCQILGYSEEEMLKMHFWEVVHPEEQMLVKERGLKRLEGDEVPQSYEFRIVRKDGKVRWIEFVADHIEIKNRKLALGTAIDITPRKVYQEGLKQEKEKLAATLRSIAEGVVVLDEKGRVSIVNKAAEKLFNQKEKDLVGLNCNEVLSFYFEDELGTREIKKVSLSFKEIIEGYQNDKLFLYKDNGDELFVAVSGSPVRINQKILGGIVVISDITEHEIYKREIVKQKKLESLATLAAGIAHDFNNLLQVLQGNIELALIKASDDLKPILERAQISLKKATGLAQRLLTFAKGGAPIKKKIENVGEFLKNMANLFLAGSSIKTIFEIAPDLYPIEADPTQLEQVFNNIFTNARDVLKNKGTITIKAENFFYDKKKYASLPLKEKYLKYIHITIEDNGPGIPHEILERIFEPYFTTKKYGTGLGLAVAYSVISKHEGYITAENNPSGGAIFHIYLPVKEGLEEKPKPKIVKIEEKDVPHSVLKKGGKETIEDFDFSSLNILFMDDEEDVRDVAEDFAYALNCNIVCVANGEDAVKEYKDALNRGERFDIVFVDLTVVGGMGGEETLKELKKIDPDVKVVVSSGYAHSAAMSQFKKLGFVNVLPKPYLLEDFKRVIFESLSD
ncbi:PAS domain S-box protein [Thermotomaculum hydrothermale]|nr:PAS domain S-box protein [Thermotomaculum hydrothermale]